MLNRRSSKFTGPITRLLPFIAPVLAVVGAWAIAYGASLGAGTAWIVLGASLLAVALLTFIGRYRRRARAGDSRGREGANGWWRAATIALFLAAACLATANGILAAHTPAMLDPTILFQDAANFGTLLAAVAACFAALAAVRSARRSGSQASPDKQADPGLTKDGYQFMDNVANHMASGRLSIDQIGQLQNMIKDLRINGSPAIMNMDSLPQADPGPQSVVGQSWIAPSRFYTAPPVFHTAPVQLSPDDQAGAVSPQRIGSFEIIRHLGQGGFGQVYLGRAENGNLVAVKVIRSEYAQTKEFRDRLAQEISASLRVSKEFTAPVVAADTSANPPWLATSYIPAPSLEALIQRCGRLPVDSVRWLGSQCADALAAIHKAGLVHRDLKPANVLVEAGRVRIIDFGIVRVAEAMGLTGTHGPIGTPLYMAPEQITDLAGISEASDIYALGATLFFAATGRPPHDGASAMQIFANRLAKPVDLSNVPGEIAEPIAACMSLQPEERPTLARVRSMLQGTISDSIQISADPTATAIPAFAPHLPATAIEFIGSYQDYPLRYNRNNSTRADGAIPPPREPPATGTQPIAP
jgi:serine/threonine protein kinase